MAIYIWVIPGAIIVAFMAVTYLRFLLHLPPITRYGCLFAAALYFGGALGVEMLGAQEEFLTDSQTTISYKILVFIEECLEMAGTVLFYHTLASYIAVSWGQVGLQLERS